MLCEDGHVVRAVKQGVVVVVVEAADRNQVGRIGEVDHLDGVFALGGHRRVGAAVPLEVGHVDGAVKHDGDGAVFAEAAGGNRAGRVGEVDHLDAVVAARGDHRVGAAVPLEVGHAGGAVKLGVVVVDEAAGGGEVGRVGEVHHLDGAVEP